jgi:gamma-polyglutamate biosynthesis protein CapA
MKKFLWFSITFFAVAVTIFLFTPRKIIGPVVSKEEQEENESTKFFNKKIKFQIEKPVNILFVGDMMFDRGVRLTINNKGIDSVFSNIKYIFEKRDLVVGNLEGTITNNASLSLPNSEILRFTFDPKIADYLKQNYFGLVSLANNHSLDFGVDGTIQTKKYLTDSGILFFGSANNNENLSQKITIEDKNFCFVGYHDLYTKDETSVLNEIEKIKPDCYKVIVFPHWGEEYLKSYTKRQQELAYKFIDKGADLIIGTHPHVLEPIEVYNGKAIFYSIGNFVFDQYFSFETEHSVAVNVTFEKEQTIFEVIPVEVKRGIVSPTKPEDEPKILESLKITEKSFSI